MYSGKVESGSQVLNSTKGKKERIGKIFQMHSNKENPVDVAHAGHIYAVIGLKDTTTGDTLAAIDKPIVLESMTFPAPLSRSPSSPSRRPTRRRWALPSRSSRKRTRRSPSSLIPRPARPSLGGMGELHLDIIVDRMRREFKVEANVGNPMVAYRETIRKKVEKYEYTHKKQTGGSGQFARVIIALEPLPADSEEEYMFEDKVTGGRVPRESHPLGRCGHQGRHAVRRSRRLPDGRHQGHAARRRLPRG